MLGVFIAQAAGRKLAELFEVNAGCAVVQVLQLRDHGGIGTYPQDLKFEEGDVADLAGAEVVLNRLDETLEAGHG
ncbi:MAG: hypothetical protein HC771_01360 [Synechococcales cyanobacterium CRU_2_2]|nr:hypothetical protein [Synechococcales cyanobacterium CRU_2_2]